MSSRLLKILVACFALHFVLPGSARGDEKLKYSEPPVSLGQPPRLRTALGLQTGYAFSTDSGGWRVFGNVTPRGKFPHLGIDLMSLELGAGQTSADEDFVDFGYYVRIPYVRLGIEYIVPVDKFTGAFTLQYALRRGGIFGGGEELRVDYRTRGNSFLVGIVLNEPFRKYRKTRPTRKYSYIPHGKTAKPSIDVETNGLPADLEASIQKVEHCVYWMDQLLTPRFVHGSVAERASAYRDHIRMPGHTFLQEDSTYHSEMALAYTIVLDGDSAGGDRLAQMAEQLIFDNVVVPYNHLFGAHKKPRTPTGLINQAAALFDSLLAGADDVTTSERVIANEVFRRTGLAIQDAADESRRRWKTTSAFWLQRAQFTWLPLNYGLRADQYDSQDEWDEIISKVTGQRYTRQNNIEYLMNEQFHPHLKQMIHQTELYQVLIIHDFQQTTFEGETDPKGWDMVADGYMRALTNAIKAIDRGKREKLPQFMLFIDQNFYVANNSYDIITYLENLYAKETVSLKDSVIEAKVQAAHDEMVAAIEASPTFSGMEREQLEELFKVHVSVTNYWDPTFAIDISMRDHRKFAFRDVFESDPSSGVGILTGTGVGQHYQPPRWEDRAILIKGPALLELKQGALRLCEGQGFDPDEVPEFLRDQPLPDDYDAKCQALFDNGWRVPVLIAFNDTGFGKKIATAMRAAIYNLAPESSVLVAIDSLWLSDFWAGMFVSAALRGGHVYGVAPSPVNAPAAAAFMMFLAYENMGLLFESREFFGDDLAPVGGRIHVGFYDHDQSVDDPIGRGSAMMQGLDKYPFITEDFPYSQGVYDLLRRFLGGVIQKAELEVPTVTDTVNVASDEGVIKPFLHMKTQFFGTEVGMRTLGLSGWVPVVQRYLEIRQKQIAGESTQGLSPKALVDVDPTTGYSTLRRDFEKYLATLPAHERDNTIFEFTIGSMNQDRRGMISDGEILANIPSYAALLGVLDMSFILATSAWPESNAQFEDLFPPPSLGTTMKKLTRYLQDVF